MDTPNLQLRTELLPLKETPKLADFYIRGNREKTHIVGGRRSWDNLIINLMQQPAIKRELTTLSLSLMSKGVQPHVRHPNFQDLHLRGEPWNIQVWKTPGLAYMRSRGYEWAEKQFLKGSHRLTWLPTTTAQCRGSQLKSTQFVYLKALAWGADF